jgi:DNA-binding protein H-NS
MGWFRKKKSNAVDLQHELEAVVSVELEQHKKAADDKIAETNEVTEKFNKILKENGFTLKIHVAAGGKRK